MRINNKHKGQMANYYYIPIVQPAAITLQYYSILFNKNLLINSLGTERNMQRMPSIRLNYVTVNHHITVYI